MNKLKPCPFCEESEPVQMMTRIGKNGWRNRYYVLCEYDSGGCGASSGWYHSEEEAAEAWNRRNRWLIDAAEAERRIVAMYRKENGIFANVFNTAIEACRTIILDIRDNTAIIPANNAVTENNIRMVKKDG